MAENIVKLGRWCRLRRAVAGASAVSGTICTGARDVTVSLTKEEADATRRASGKWVDRREVLSDVTLTFDLVASESVPEVDDMLAFRLAYTNDTGMALFVDTGHGAVYGLNADYIVTRFERSETLRDVAVYNVECHMTQRFGNFPTWLPTQP